MQHNGSGELQLLLLSHHSHHGHIGFSQDLSVL